MTGTGKNVKKIVIVSDTIYPYFKGGKEHRILEISTRLARMGQDVHIYTMKWWEGDKTKVENGVTLHGICKLRDVYRDESRRSVFVSLLFALSCLRLFSVNFDVIDVDHMPYLQLFTVWFVCKLKGKKMYATWHEVWDKSYWKEYFGKFGTIGYFIERMGGMLPSYILVNSSSTKQKLIERHPSKENRLIDAYNGIDLKKIAKAKPSTDAYDVMYAGRLIKHKNVGMLIKALAIVKQTYPRVSCTILGDGPDKANLIRLAQKLSLQDNVDFKGFLPDHDDVYSYMKTSRVVVQPSKREGFGLVIVEANACGRPVLTLDHPDNAGKDLIKQGINGYSFKTTAQLAAHICEYMAASVYDPKLYTDEAKQYDWQAVAKNVMEAYCL